jgi:hypothetical protein
MAQLNQGMADFDADDTSGETVATKAQELLQLYNGDSTNRTSLVPPSRMAAQPILSGNTYKTLNMPTSITVYGGMDAATAEAFVRRVVRSEFGV